MKSNRVVQQDIRVSGIAFDFRMLFCRLCLLN